MSDPAAERYARVQAAMARHGVGALCLATPHLGAFASGARRVQVAGSGGTVPWVVLLAGAPSAVVFTPDPDGAPDWMPRAALEPLRWDRARQIERIADLVSGTGGAVGCDVLTPGLREAIGGRMVVDAAAVLADAVAPRSAVEIEAIGRALGAVRTGLRGAAAAVAPGTSADDVRARFFTAVAGTGAGFPLGEGMVRRMRGPFDGPFREGDVVRLEFGLYVDRHAGVAAATVACGVELSAARRRWAEALCAVATRCRAGARLDELRAAVRAAGAGQEGLLAHGLGVGIEPPLVDLDAADETTLRAGTVLVLAPVLDLYRASRALLVTESGHRWLEPAP